MSLATESLQYPFGCRSCSNMFLERWSTNPSDLGSYRGIVTRSTTIQGVASMNSDSPIGWRLIRVYTAHLDRRNCERHRNVGAATWECRSKWVQEVFVEMPR